MDKSNKASAINDGSLTTISNIAAEWGVEESSVRYYLAKHNILPVLKNTNRRTSVFNRNDCDKIYSFVKKQADNKSLLNDFLCDEKYIQPKEMIRLAKKGQATINRWLRESGIMPLKTIVAAGTYAFYDRKKCLIMIDENIKKESLAHAYRKKIEEQNKQDLWYVKNDAFVSMSELKIKYGLSRSTIQKWLTNDGLTTAHIGSTLSGLGESTFYEKEKAFKILDKATEHILYINDKKYVRSLDLAKEWGISRSGVEARLKNAGVTSIKTKNGMTFYLKSDCVSASHDISSMKKEILMLQCNEKYITPNELLIKWGSTSSGVACCIAKHGLKPKKKFFIAGINTFYDRAECERARPFINQPKQEVEEVEQVNLPETETNKEELEIEKNSALSDDEVRLILDQCKDPIDKVMVLSVLCFGIKTGELDLLNIADVNGDKISLQSPSGMIKMRISSQYREAFIDLTQFYIDKGWTVNNDTALFLNQSGVRMTRQGMNARIKNISDKISIGREFTIGALRATFAQRICKETNKDIGSVHKYLRLNDNTSVMSYLLDFQSREQKTMSDDLMNSLTASYQVKEPLSTAEPKEQTPDIIPADTIDLFTMSELESELKQRGVELTDEVKAKINASDMPEMQEIATMIRGNSKTIAIRLSVLNKIAGQLKPVKKLSFYERVLAIGKNKTEKEEPKKIPVDFFPKSGNNGVFYLDKELKPCPFCGSVHIEMSCEEITPGYWVSKILCNGCETRNEHDNSTKEVVAEELADFWNRRINDKVDSEAKTISDKGICVNQELKDKLRFMAMADNVDLIKKLESIIMAAWVMGNYDNK